MDKPFGALAKMRAKEPNKKGFDMTDVWNDLTPGQHKYLNDFICGQTTMFYEESELWDIIGITPYTIDAYFPFVCRSMIWANNRIRTQYYAGVGRNFTGVAWRSDDIDSGFDRANDATWGVQGANLTKDFNLKRVSFYKNGV